MIDALFIQKILIWGMAVGVIYGECKIIQNTFFSWRAGVVILSSVYWIAFYIYMTLAPLFGWSTGLSNIIVRSGIMLTVFALLVKVTKVARNYGHK